MCDSKSDRGWCIITRYEACLLPMEDHINADIQIATIVGAIRCSSCICKFIRRSRNSSCSSRNWQRQPTRFCAIVLHGAMRKIITDFIFQISHFLVIILTQLCISYCLSIILILFTLSSFILLMKN